MRARVGVVSGGVVLLGLVLGGCAGGPAVERPGPPPSVTRGTTAPPTAMPSGTATSAAPEPTASRTASRSATPRPKASTTRRVTGTKGTRSPRRQTEPQNPYAGPHPPPAPPRPSPTPEIPPPYPPGDDVVVIPVPTSG
ncbi:hypothetical protein ABZZ37_04870 [Streptomyces sp. NPDC006464]|uniref:hypothetical protein n=1 Tax=Streptomyces sp. NPDC006464 TaxID=3154305 RepID=UPI0033ADC3BC